MGWLSSPSWDTKQSMVEHIVQNFNLIDHAVRGKVVYGLDKNGEGFPEGFGIIVCLLDNFADRGKPAEWGYKDMCESCYPYAFDCPERILSRSTNMREKAIQWRQACREQRKAKWNFVSGQKVRFTAEILPSDLHEVREWVTELRTLSPSRRYWVIKGGNKVFRITNKLMLEFKAEVFKETF